MYLPVSPAFLSSVCICICIFSISIILTLLYLNFTLSLLYFIFTYKFPVSSAWWLRWRRSSRAQKAWWRFVCFFVHIDSHRNRIMWEQVYLVFHLIGVSSCCTNPILYGFLNDNFQKVMNLFLSWKLTKEVSK